MNEYKFKELPIIPLLLVRINLKVFIFKPILIEIVIIIQSKELGVLGKDDFYLILNLLILLKK